MVFLSGVGTDGKLMLALINFPDSGPGTAMQCILAVKIEQIRAFWPPDQRAPLLPSISFSSEIDSSSSPP